MAKNGRQQTKYLPIREDISVKDQFGWLPLSIIKPTKESKLKWKDAYFSDNEIDIRKTSSGYTEDGIQKMSEFHAGLCERRAVSSQHFGRVARGVDGDEGHVHEPALVGIARATGGDVFNAATPEALHAVFKSIDEMKKVVVLQKQPQASDYYEPFFIPAITLLALSVLALFGLRFTPW